jgi:outer membrane murein-binding lipoprotein Lpp
MSAEKQAQRLREIDELLAECQRHDMTGVRVSYAQLRALRAGTKNPSHCCASCGLEAIGADVRELRARVADLTAERDDLAAQVAAAREQVPECFFWCETAGAWKSCTPQEIDRISSRGVPVRSLYAAPLPPSQDARDAERYMPVAAFLWDLLDEIDTAGDMAKGDDKLYRAIVERTQRRRFEVGSTDGYSLNLKPDAAILAAKEKK